MPDVVEVSVHIAAPPAAVFGYLTDPGRYPEWMGSAAVLDPVPGGIYQVRMGDGFAAAWQAYLHRLAIRAAGGDPGPDPHSQEVPD